MQVIKQFYIYIYSTVCSTNVEEKLPNLRGRPAYFSDTISHPYLWSFDPSDLL